MPRKSKHKPPHMPTPIERKTATATASAGVLGTLLAVVVAGVRDGSIDISWIPTWLQPILILLGIPAATFVPAFYTRHTARPEVAEEATRAAAGADTTAYAEAALSRHLDHRASVAAATEPSILPETVEAHCPAPTP